MQCKVVHLANYVECNPSSKHLPTHNNEAYTENHDTHGLNFWYVLHTSKIKTMKHFNFESETQQLLQDALIRTTSHMIDEISIT